MSRQTISTSGKVFRVKFRNQVDALYLVPIGSTNSLSQEGAKLAFMQTHFPKLTETNFDFALYNADLVEFRSREEVRANCTVYFARVPATERKVWLSAQQREQLEAAKSAKADSRPSFEEEGAAWKREMRRWRTFCKICHQKNSHTTNDCFYGKNFDGAKRASGIPRSMLQAVAPGTSHVVVDTFGVASQTRVQLEAYREAEQRRFRKVNHEATTAEAAGRGNRMMMFSSGVVPDSLKCPACEKLLCVPQKMTPCGCVVCLDCSDSVVESQMENMECPLCKKLLHETPDYVNDDETQQRLHRHSHCGSGPESSSGVSSDDSQEKSSTETDVRRYLSTESNIGEEVEKEVRAPKRKVVVSKPVAPPPECRQQIEVLAPANSPCLSPPPPPRSESPLPPARTAAPASQPLALPDLDFDPLAAFNAFLASEDKRDKEVKRWLEVSRRRREEIRFQRRRYYDEERHVDYRRSKPYYGRS